MNRTLKRPMFRMGGSSNEGITSGLDRAAYQFGTKPVDFPGTQAEYDAQMKRLQGQGIFDASGQRTGGKNKIGFDDGDLQFPPTSGITLNSTTNNTPSIKTKTTEEKLMEAIGKRDRGQDISKFLINFGLNLASATPRGNIIATAAEAAKGPSGDLFDQIDADKDLERQIKLAAAQSDIGQEQAVELQLLKNLDEDTRSAIRKKAKEGFDAGYYDSIDEGIRRLLQKDEFGVQNMPGEQRENDIRTISENLQKTQRLSPIVADKQAEFFVDFNRIETANPDVNFDVNNPFWSPERTSYQEGTVYFDPIGNKYFRRDSGAEAGEGVPQGFVEVQIN